MSNDKMILGFAALAVLALVTSLVLVRMEQAERANNRPRPRVKTDVPRSVRDAFSEGGADGNE